MALDDPNAQGPASSLILLWYYISIPDGTYKRNEMQSIINTMIQKATGKGGDECPQCTIDAASFRTVFALPTQQQINQHCFN